MDWAPTTTAPKDAREIEVTIMKGRRGALVGKSGHGQIFIWSGNGWHQKINNEWHRAFFEPTHWRSLKY